MEIKVKITNEIAKTITVNENYRKVKRLKSQK